MKSKMKWRAESFRPLVSMATLSLHYWSRAVHVAVVITVRVIQMLYEGSDSLTNTRHVMKKLILT